MKNCENCNNQYDVNASFCPTCGAKNNMVGQVQPTAQEVNSVMQQPVNAGIAQSVTPVQQPVQPVAPVQPPVEPKKSNSKLFVIIGFVVLISIIIVLTIALVINTRKNRELINNSSIYTGEYQFNYDEVPYYIDDNDVVITNTTATTAARTTSTSKVTSTTVSQTTRPVTTPTTTTRSTYVTTTKTNTTEKTTVKTTQSTTQSTYQTTVKPSTTQQTTQQSTTKNTSTTTTTTTTTTTSSGVYTTHGVTTRTSYVPTTTTTTTRVITTQAPTVEEKKKISRSVLVYLVGTDLESNGYAASRDIYEMAQVKDEATDFYVLLGGSKQWGIDGLNNGDILHVKDGGYTKIGINGNLNMGDPNILASFINTIDGITDSEYYDLILWDHGGGPIIGYGVDEVNNDRLYANEIATALAATKFNKNRKFEFIGFDACLMGSIEMANLLDEYASYYIASEESEYNLGWTYDKGFENASRLDSISLGKQIINSFADSNAEYSQKLGTQFIYTLSLVDLSKVDNVVNKLNERFKSVDVTSQFSNLSKSRLDTLEFGDNGYDLIDLKMFSDKLGFNDLSSTITDAVVYSNSNLKNSTGLSIYYPLHIDKETTDLILSKVYPIFFADFKDYNDFLSNYYNLYNGAPITKSYTESSPGTLKSEFDKDERVITMELTDEQAQNYARGFYLVFRDMGEGYYTPVFRGDNVVLRGNKLGGFYDRKIVCFDSEDDGEAEDGESDIAFAMAFQGKLTNRGTLYNLSTRMENWDDGFKNYRSELGYLQVYVKDGQVDIDGIVPKQETNEDISKNKIKWQIEDWRTVQFWNFRYIITDEGGHYTLDWKSHPTYIGHELVPYKYPNYHFFMNEIEDDVKYVAVMNAFDYQGNRITSDLIPLN